MSQITEIQQDLVTAFNTDLADFVETFVVQRDVDGVYDPTTGEYSTARYDYSSRGIFEHYKTFEINKDSEIKASDVKLTSIQSELGTIPSIDDVIIKDSQNYTVKKVRELSGIAYEFQLQGV